jgi:hypothetical protein
VRRDGGWGSRLRTLGTLSRGRGGCLGKKPALAASLLPRVLQRQAWATVVNFAVWLTPKRCLHREISRHDVGDGTREALRWFCRKFICALTTQCPAHKPYPQITRALTIDCVSQQSGKAFGSLRRVFSFLENGGWNSRNRLLNRTFMRGQSARIAVQLLVGKDVTCQ